MRQQGEEISLLLADCFVAEIAPRNDSTFLNE